MKSPDTSYLQPSNDDLPGNKCGWFALHPRYGAGRQRRKTAVGPPLQLRRARNACQHLEAREADKAAGKGHAAAAAGGGAQHPGSLLLAATDGRRRVCDVTAAAGRLDPVGGQGLARAGPLPDEGGGGDELAAIFGLDVGGAGGAARPLPHPRGQQQEGGHGQDRRPAAHPHAAGRIRSLKDEHCSKNFKWFWNFDESNYA